MKIGIQSESAYNIALKQVEPLLAAEPVPGTKEYVTTMALVNAIEVYETAQGWNLAEASTADLAEFRRDQMQAGELVPA